MKTINFKIVVFSTIAYLLINAKAFSQVGIGTSTPNVSAMLDVNSTSKGFLPPRMDTASRDLISTPANGLLIYNLDTNKLNYYNGSSWEVIETDSSGYVDLTTNQNNIAGNKTFTGNLIAEGRLMIPMGEISFFDFAGFTVPLTSISTGASGNDGMIKLDPTVSGAFPLRVPFVNDMFGTGSNSRLTYTGTVGRYFHIALSFSYTPSTNGDTFVFGVARNATVQNSSKVFIRTQTTSDHQSSAMHVLLWLNPNDYLEFWAGNTERNTSSIKLKSFNFVAIGM